MELDIPFEEAVNDPNSPEFLAKAKELEGVLLDTFKDLPGVSGVIVTKLTPGSTVVSFNVIMEPGAPVNIDASTIGSTMEAALTSPAFQDIGAIPDQTVVVTVAGKFIFYLFFVFFSPNTCLETVSNFFKSCLVISLFITPSLT